MKKVGFIIPKIGGGGAEKVIIDIILNLQKECDITLFTYESGEVYEDEIIRSKKITYIPLDIRNKNTFIKIMTIRKLLIKYNFDSFVSFLYYSNIVTFFAALGLQNKPKLILSERGNPIIYLSKGFKNKIWKILLKKAYQNCDVFVPNSIEMGQNIKTHFRLKKENSFVIQNSINTDFIDSSLETLNKNTKERYILSIGRLIDVKNHIGLIKAFSSYIELFPNSNLNLHIIGQGPLKNSILELISSLKLTERVKLKGFIKQPYPHISNAIGYIHNSNYEGFPNAILEALYINGVVASTNCQTGPKEMITNNKNGFLYEVNDQKALVKIIEVFDQESETTTKMKALNKKTIKSLFGLEVMLSKYKQIILS